MTFNLTQLLFLAGCDIVYFYSDFLSSIGILCAWVTYTHTISHSGYVEDQIRSRVFMITAFR